MFVRQKPQNALYRLIGYQVITMGIVALIVGLGADVRVASSFMLAGLICALVNLYFTWQVFCWQSVRFAKRIFLAFYLGEGLKLLMMSVLFVVSVMYIPVDLMAFIFGFIASVLFFWMAPFWVLGFKASKAI